ncbi:MAG: class I SAM-dependent RNA methyltransferase [Bacteroidota bacterium]
MFRLIAKTYAGFEEIAAEELLSFGAAEVSAGHRAVLFKGDLETMYKANLHSRYSLRILRHIHSFPAPNEQQLYDGISRMDWSDFLAADGSLAIDAALTKSNLTHSQFVAQKTKDAIVDQFRMKFGRRPDVDLESPSLRINVYIHENVASISLDSSGSSLHKRGYRVHQGVAPLSEVMSAGMIKLAGWDKSSSFLDPFCGSGTLLIEAALMAGNFAPGIFRKRFGFMSWRDYDQQLWQRLVTEARSQENPGNIPAIVGLDIDRRTVGYAAENVASAGLLGKIKLENASFMDFTPDSAGPWFIVSNPPYGERISSSDLAGLYKGIGNTLKRSYPGSTAWLLSGSREAEKNIGLRPARRLPLWNGPIECRFLKFELYSGSKRKGESDPS